MTVLQEAWVAAPKLQPQSLKAVHSAHVAMSAQLPQNQQFATEMLKQLKQGQCACVC